MWRAEGRNSLYFETAHRTNVAEHRHVSKSVVAESEIFPDQYGTDVQLVNQRSGDKLFGRKLREIVTEGQDADLFDTERTEPFEALLEGPDESRCVIRREDLGGVWIERDDRRDFVVPPRACELQEEFNDALVTPVQSIENPNCDA